MARRDYIQSIDDSVAPDRLGPAVTFATTEHFNLQTARAATISEANGRASIYLAALSSNLIALAFIGQMSRLGTAFRMVAVVNSVVIGACAGLIAEKLFTGSLSLALAVGVVTGVATPIVQRRHHIRVRDAYAPEAVDRAAIFVRAAQKTAETA